MAMFFGGFGGAPATTSAAFGAAEPSAASSGVAGAVPVENPNHDYPVLRSPADTVSCLRWSTSSRTFGPNVPQQHDLLAAASWSREVAIYEVQNSRSASLKAHHKHPAPVLSLAWQERIGLFTGGCDKTVQLLNVETGQHQQVGAHDAPVKAVYYIEQMGLVVSGSWDKNIKFWDARQSFRSTAATVNLPERMWAMDVSHPVMVVSCATDPQRRNRTHVFDLSTPPSQPHRSVEPLKHQQRSLAIFPDKRGFAIGGVEGRVAISHVADNDTRLNFAFKCHRQDPERIFAVNDICFHQQQGTFATVGGDGVYTFWDKDSKQRLKLFNATNNSLTACQFNPSGTIFAYAVGYDYSAGADAFTVRRDVTSIMLHHVEDSVIARRRR